MKLTPEQCEQAARSLEAHSGNIFRHKAVHALRCHSELVDALRNTTAQLEGFLEGQEDHPLWGDVRRNDALIAKATGAA
ncbi:MAG: hypothetical protein ACPG4X_14525 [Pikeienuella sp.]